MARRTSSSRRPRRRSMAEHRSRSGGVWRGIGIVLLALGLAGGAVWFLRTELGLGPNPTESPAKSPSGVQAISVERVRPTVPPPPVAPVEVARAAAEPVGERMAIVYQPPPPPPPADASGYPRVVANLLEAQIALARRHISSGSIDGVAGAQTAAALAAFQEVAELPRTGRLDDATRARLVLTSPAFVTHVLETADFAGLQPLAPTWLGKSEQSALAHETLLERLAERCQAHPNLLRRLNPGVNWETAAPGLPLNLPAVERIAPAAPVAWLHVRLADRVLQARDAQGGLLAHFPVSIAKRVDKRPAGELRITVVVPDPNYTFSPEVFPESAEARELGRKLILAPGPNNPVGVAWIGLNMPSYGIHGTPTPEQVGRTESHGCFRLANWDARALLGLVRTGMPVRVDP